MIADPLGKARRGICGGVFFKEGGVLLNYRLRAGAKRLLKVLFKGKLFKRVLH